MTDKAGTTLHHGRLDLRLHRLGYPTEVAEGATQNQNAADDDVKLLCLHQLGGRAGDFKVLDPHLDLPWSGPVWALDLSGHGDSDWAPGGGYASETLLGDVDAAVQQLGCVVLLGSGLGAYLALLEAGSRPRRVLATVLAPGSGLAGGGPQPVPRKSLALPESAAFDRTDPLALAELAREIRPPGYAQLFVRQIAHLNPHSTGDAGVALWTTVDENTTSETPWLSAVSARARRAPDPATALREIAAMLAAGG